MPTQWSTGVLGHYSGAKSHHLNSWVDSSNMSKFFFAQGSNSNTKVSRPLLWHLAKLAHTRTHAHAHAHICTHACTTHTHTHTHTVHIPCIPLGATSLSLRPHSLRKPMATSTLSSVGFSSSSVNISKAISSWTWQRNELHLHRITVISAAKPLGIYRPHFTSTLQAANILLHMPFSKTPFFISQKKEF